MPKSRNSPKHPALMSQEEQAQLAVDIVNALKNGRSVHDRREMVLKLVTAGVRRAEMIHLVCKSFGIRPGTLDDDIAWAKDYWLKWASTKSREQAMAEAVMTTEEVKRRGFINGDLSAVNQANKQHSELFKLTRSEDELPNTALGVIVLPSKQAADLWQKQTQSQNPANPKATSLPGAPKAPKAKT